MSKPDPREPPEAIAAQRPPKRPEELEDWLNGRIYHPLSHQLALMLSKTRISPNMVSVIGGMCVVLAAALYTKGSGTGLAVLGLLAHMSWHVLDGADGDLARMTQRESAYGETVDGLCDYLSHLVLYLVLAAMLAEEIGPAGWALMIGAGLARGVQTIFYETQRRQYQWWVYGKPWLRVAGTSGPGAGGLISALAGVYVSLGSVLATRGEGLDARIDGITEDHLPAARTLIRKSLKPMLAPLSVLSSNYRTLVIGIAVILGQPLVIVAFELVLLTMIMLVLLRQANGRITNILSQLPTKSDR